MRALSLFLFVSTLLITFMAKAEGLVEGFRSFAGFELGTVKLADVQNQLGKVKVVETGDAGDYTASVCYIVPNGVVMFFSGEMDGPDHYLGGFGFAKETERRPCVKWPANKVIPNLVIGGLRLGLTMKEFTDIVGTSVRREGNKAYVFFEGKRVMTELEISRLPKEFQGVIKTVDIAVSVVASFANGHLVELRVWNTYTT